MNLIVGFHESVRDVRKLHSRPATDQELRLLPRSPSAVGAADPGIEAFKGAGPWQWLPTDPRAPLSRSQPLRLTSPERLSPEEAACRRWSTETFPWTKVPISPCTLRVLSDQSGDCDGQKTPVNRPLLRPGADRFTRERSLVRAQPCPSKSPANRDNIACSLTRPRGVGSADQPGMGQGSSLTRGTSSRRRSK